MTMLLRPYAEFPPPGDYLLARVRSRRARIDVAGEREDWPGQLSEAGFRNVVQWLYRRLTPTTGRRLHPYFELLGGRSLVIALRLHRAESREAMQRLLQQSLLHADLTALFLQTAAPDQLIVRLDAALGCEYPELRGLAAAYSEQGPGGAEELIASRLLQRAVRKATPCVLRQLVARLVDLRNILSIGKYWRWQVSHEPVLNDGGSVSPEKLRRLWAQHDEAGLSQLVLRLARQDGPLPQDVRSMEFLLLQGITTMMRQCAKDPLGLGVLLDYLWRCQVAVRNRALVKVRDEQAKMFFDELKVMP